ncbi:SH3 domain-containing protein [Leptospira bandrabouensis]|nr:SH3 domain-containing protein [Leptospira bandrabouensis]MCG6154130.1 SH3 domain-containing protein [Leptospira bandrabouensis]
MNKIIFLFLVLNFPLFSQENFTVNANTLRVRNLPSSNAEIVGKLNKGIEVTIISKSDKFEEINGTISEWIEVQTIDKSQKGYIFGAYLESKINPNPFTKCFKNKKGITIFLNNGKSILLKNGLPKNDEDPQEFIQFNNCKYYKDLDSVLIEYSMHEGGGNEIYNLKNGKFIQIWGHPIFSKNKKYFACFSADIEVEFYPNGIQIYQLNLTPIKEFEYEFESSDMNKNFQPTDLEWTSEDSIKVILKNIDLTKTKIVNFKKTDKKWTLITKP